MERRALPLSSLKEKYDVLVVGSGYGGAIAASRFARTKQSVCLLERGREIVPGEFPDTPSEALAEINASVIGKKDSSDLFDMRLGEDLVVMVGRGLGGTSLINAGVTIWPERRLFEDPRWPQALRDDLDLGLAEGRARAEQMLGSKTYPEHLPALAKMEALKRSAEANHWVFCRVPINVTFEDGPNSVGLNQSACTLCGDCISGCNIGAKNTTAMNYIPDAVIHGAEIFCNSQVAWLEREGEHWRVFFDSIDSGLEAFDAGPMSVAADIVVLAAGSLGSSEILFRSKEQGLTLSEQLGKHFGANGDVIGFGYNNDTVINGVGIGADDSLNGRASGPCITAMIDISADDLDASMIIEEGALPSALSIILPPLYAGADLTLGFDTDGGIVDELTESGRELKSLFQGSYRGAVQNSQTYLVMSHDDCTGTLQMDNDRLAVHWPGLASLPHFAHIEDNLQRATKALGGTYIKNPLSTKLLSHRQITVHPLGGCVMAESAQTGVVNHLGQLYSSNHGDECHPGLFVCDGSIIPRSLGKNPLLTISALAERNSRIIAEQNGWSIDYCATPPEPPSGATAKLGLSFTERMVGYYTTNQYSLDHYLVEVTGRQDNTTIAFTLTVFAEDLERLLSEPGYKAKLIGTVSAPTLCQDDATIFNGTFTLFNDDPEHPDGRRMEYHFSFNIDNGTKLNFHGHKKVQDDPGFDLWDDTTTLYASLESEQKDFSALALLRINLRDFAQQLTTIRVTNANSSAERLDAIARFGQHFATGLFDRYGGIYARASDFDPTAPVRKRRNLRLPIAEEFPFQTRDGTDLQLIRYRGGHLGPVLLIHGLGVSSAIFTVDTIDTNLVEYLVAHQYDVWLLDLRVSTDLPSSKESASVDLVALDDIPTAISVVKAISKQQQIDVVAHCFGAVAFTIAALSGITGIRSAVLSQVSTHMVSPLRTRIKARLKLPKLLLWLGLKTLTAYTDKQSPWKERLVNRLLRVIQPRHSDERCTSSVCHRVEFLYGQLYEHQQLNTATHKTLHELFGVANIATLDQLSMMVNSGQLVDRHGNDTYLHKLVLLDFPITFIHGEENACYLPDSTEQTYRKLTALHPGGKYQRHLIPGYGHIDCIFGKNAVDDVYPYIVKGLRGRS